MSINKNFCLLHRHDSFSLLDGYGLPEDCAKYASERGFQFLGISNHGTVEGLVKHQRACEKYGITPIAGVEMYCVPDPEIKNKDEKRGHLTIWIKDTRGFSNVLKMLSQANLHYFYRRPRIGYQMLLDHAEGLVIGTACAASFLNLEGGIDFFKKLHDKIGDDLYLEVMPHQYQINEDHVNLCLDLHEKYGVKLLGTHDSHYIEPNDYEVHDILLCCQTKRKLDDPTRWRFDIQNLFMCDKDYFINEFKKQGILTDPEIKQAIASTMEVVEKCKDFRIEQKEISLPIPPQYKGQDEIEVFNKLIKDGFKRRFNDELDNHPEYKEQVEKEYELIKEKNFIRYFLIVTDLVVWAKESGILVGPGRGSVSGSTIAFLLNITDIDPLVHKTNFSRFLNNGRSKYNPPDIDVDFPDNKREDISKRLQLLYGENNIAGVTTFLRIEEKSAIKDVAKVFDIPFQEVNNFTKNMIDLETSLGTQEGIDFNNKFPLVIKFSQKLRGQYRAYGRHAAAQIISSEDLTLGTRANLAERNGHLVIGLDMEDAEYAGLLKLDVLGLSNLTVINHCLNLIEENKGIKIDLNKIPLDDKNIFKQLSNSNCTGIFQFNTWSMSRLSKDMVISSFQEMVAALALVRPGPMNSGITQRYINNKKSGTWEKKHEIYEEITKETYSELIYQEQILEIFTKIAGLSEEVADKIRKVIGKKRDKEFFLPYLEQFLKGVKTTGYFTEQEALSFWDELLKFAEYAFSKNHAVAYAKIGYDCCYLRENFPSEFICASLTHGGEAEKPALLKEATRLGLKVCPPLLASSHASNWIADASKKTLRIPFSEVKGLGPAAIKTIQQYQDSLKPGFFTKEKPALKGKLLTILNDIGAFNEESDPPTQNIDNYFLDLGIVLNPFVKYANLYNLIGKRENINLSNWLVGDVIGESHGREISESGKDSDLMQCCECELRGKCKHPLAPRIGKFNVVIIGENPNQDEMRSNKPFDSRDGKILWNSLQKYGFEESDFLKTHVVKCPTKKPPMSIIKKCSEKHLKKELESCRIVLAIGNTAVGFFKGDNKGIIRLNGTTEWNEENSCWVCWAIPPGWSTWKPEDFEKPFKHAIKNYVSCLERCGGFV